jgi:hypothetical protein
MALCFAAPAYALKVERASLGHGVEAWYAERGVVAASYGQDDHLKVMIEATPSHLGEDETKQLAAIMQIHPSAVTISSMPVLPRLNSGKIDYSCLNTKH